jgi:hypothetical protein
MKVRETRARKEEHALSCIDNMNQTMNMNGENRTDLGPVRQSQEAAADARLQVAVCQMLAEVTCTN